LLSLLRSLKYAISVGMHLMHKYDEKNTSMEGKQALFLSQSTLLAVMDGSVPCQ